MSDRPLAANSIAEAHLYLRVTCCSACKKGPLDLETSDTELEHIDTVVAMNCLCRNCAARHTLRFRIDSHWVRPSNPPVINPTKHPSRLIDAAQWLSLYYDLADTAQQTSDRELSRHRKYEAALCIEEALKFYGEDNDLPPDAAFFVSSRREHARRHPQRFARQHLLDLRARMPHLGMQTQLQRPPIGRKWWRFWRSSGDDSV